MGGTKEAETVEVVDLSMHDDYTPNPLPPAPEPRFIEQGQGHGLPMAPPNGNWHGGPVFGPMGVDGLQNTPFGAPTGNFDAYTYGNNANMQPAFTTPQRNGQQQIPFVTPPSQSTNSPSENQSRKRRKPNFTGDNLQPGSLFANTTSNGDTGTPKRCLFEDGSVLWKFPDGSTKVDLSNMTPRTPQTAFPPGVQATPAVPFTPNTPGPFAQQARNQRRGQIQPVQLGPSNQQIKAALDEVVTVLGNLGGVIQSTTIMAKRMRELEANNQHLEEQVKALGEQTKAAVKEMNAKIVEAIQASDDVLEKNGDGPIVPGGAYGGPPAPQAPRDPVLQNLMRANTESGFAARSPTAGRDGANSA